MRLKSCFIWFLEEKKLVHILAFIAKRSTKFKCDIKWNQRSPFERFTWWVIGPTLKKSMFSLLSSSFPCWFKSKSVCTYIHFIDKTTKKLVEGRYPFTKTSSISHPTILATVFLSLISSSSQKCCRFCSCASTWKRTFWYPFAMKRTKNMITCIKTKG